MGQRRGWRTTLPAAVPDSARRIAAAASVRGRRAAEPHRLAVLADRRLVVTTPCGKRLVAASLGDAWIVRSAAVDLARSG